MQEAQNNYVQKEELLKAQESEDYLRSMVGNLGIQFKAEKAKNEKLENKLTDILEGRVAIRQVKGKPTHPDC